MIISRSRMGSLVALAALMGLAPRSPALAGTLAPAPVVGYHSVDVQGIKVFYREAGDPAAPTILLLHGFPASSHMYRGLIPLLADRYHVVAPDLPGFGFSDAPSPSQYVYTFDHLASTIDAFTTTLGLQHYAIEVFDYGAPVGWRLAVAHPDRITAIVTQNGNAYEEGLSSGWNPIQKYWNEPSEANRAALRDFLTPGSVKWQYVHGSKNEALIAPESYTLDSALLARPGNDDIQLDLFLDYANNVKRYPEFQSYFRKFHPPLLAVWGRNDPFFLPPGAEAFKRDISDAEVYFYDAGHFALETNLNEIAAQIHRFLDHHLLSDKTNGAKHAKAST
jgi:pimeloyl-ACP methyl ester carboxylesterase